METARTELVASQGRRQEHPSHVGFVSNNFDLAKGDSSSRSTDWQGNRGKVCEQVNDDASAGILGDDGK